MIGVPVKKVICGILAYAIESVIKHVKLMTIWILKLSLRKRLVDKLALECEDEILHTTETLLNDEKVAGAKNNYFIQIISLLIACLLLLVGFCVSY